MPKYKVLVEATVDVSVLVEAPNKDAALEAIDNDSMKLMENNDWDGFLKMATSGLNIQWILPTASERISSKGGGTRKKAPVVKAAPVGQRKGRGRGARPDSAKKKEPDKKTAAKKPAASKKAPPKKAATSKKPSSAKKKAPAKKAGPARKGRSRGVAA